MKPILPLAALATTLFLQPASAAEQVVTLGDSLTFAYEAEFGFQLTIPFIASYGDGFGPEVRNWAEILNDPAYRNASFDLGPRDTMSVSVPFAGTVEQLLRHKHNWAIPGLKVDELRRFISGDATILDLLDPDSALAVILSYSNFEEATDFALDDLETQIQSTAERLTFFIGGNDIRGVYRDIYNGLPAGTFIADFISDTAVVLDRVLELNPNLQIVVVNVPHVGITPDVKSLWPTDPVKTERVTLVLRELNRQLAELASARGLGYADIFTPTLSLLEAAPLCIHGITFVNGGSTTGDLDYVWLNGPISANFHPNTNAQAIIANEIISAFNQRYGTGIAPLTATEILAGLHGKSPSQIDMPFATWMAGYGLAGLADDSDGDGIAASVEFALGLNPTLRDSHKITTALVQNAGSTVLELAYPIRLPGSTRYGLIPAYSADLSGTFAPFTVVPATGSDGLARARIPVSGSTGFLRLESTVAP